MFDSCAFALIYSYYINSNVKLQLRCDDFNCGDEKHSIFLKQSNKHNSDERLSAKTRPNFYPGSNPKLDAIPGPFSSFGSSNFYFMDVSMLLRGIGESGL